MVSGDGEWWSWWPEVAEVALGGRGGALEQVEVATGLELGEGEARRRWLAERFSKE